MISPHPHIAAMAPYALANIQAPPAKPLISLAQNESFRPPSPLAFEAAKKALLDASEYPDPDWTALRHALAEHHTLHPEQVLCGAGSLDLIGCLMRLYAGPERAVLAPAHAYPFFRSAALIVNARFDKADENATTVCVDALLDAVKPDTAVVCVANPGNPTGTRVSHRDIHRLRDNLRDDILLILDEAYGEFADHIDPSMFDLSNRGDTVILRTFSKAYGLAGCRVGWGVFPPAICDEMRKVMNPNNVSAASQAAALGAVQDHAYMRATCDLLAASRDRARTRLVAAGLTVAPSFTNFLLIDFGTSKKAQAADRALKAEGVFLRRQAGAGLPQCLRMTIGPEPHVKKALSILETHVLEYVR